jgi:ABC-type phosphate transport system permease subunit
MPWPLTSAQTVTALISTLGALVALAGAIATAIFASKNLSRERLNQRLNLIMTEQKYFEDIRK